MTVVVCTRSLGHVSDEVDGFPKAVEILHLFLFCNSSFIDRGYCNKFSLYFLSYDHTPVCLSDVLPFNSTNIYWLPTIFQAPEWHTQIDIESLTSSSWQSVEETRHTHTHKNQYSIAQLDWDWIWMFQKFFSHISDSLLGHFHRWLIPTIMFWFILDFLLEL